MEFFRDPPFVRVFHTFVMTNDPGAWLIEDISLDLPLASAVTRAVIGGKKEIGIPVATQRIAVFQENVYEPQYPEYHISN